MESYCKKKVLNLQRVRFQYSEYLCLKLEFSVKPVEKCHEETFSLQATSFVRILNKPRNDHQSNLDHVIPTPSVYNTFKSRELHNENKLGIIISLQILIFFTCYANSLLLQRMKMLKKKKSCFPKTA